jgi:hypothetical protein
VQILVSFFVSSFALEDLRHLCIVLYIDYFMSHHGFLQLLVEELQYPGRKRLIFFKRQLSFIDLADEWFMVILN